MIGRLICEGLVAVGFVISSSTVLEVVLGVVSRHVERLSERRYTLGLSLPFFLKAFRLQGKSRCRSTLLRPE